MRHCRSGQFLARRLHLASFNTCGVYTAIMSPRHQRTYSELEWQLYEALLLVADHGRARVRAFAWRRALSQPKATVILRTRAERSELTDSAFDGTARSASGATMQNYAGPHKVCKLCFNCVHDLALDRAPFAHHTGRLTSEQIFAEHLMYVPVCVCACVPVHCGM